MSNTTSSDRPPTEPDFIGRKKSGRVHAHGHGSAPAGADPDADAPRMTPLTPSEVDFMPPLLHSLATLLRLRGRNVSPQFLLAGLAGAGKVSAGACLRAAERAGLKGRIVYRPSLADISPLTLPCILLLRDDRSCVLLKLEADSAEIVFPEYGETAQTVSRQTLHDE